MDAPEDFTFQVELSTGVKQSQITRALDVGNMQQTNKNID